jgi:hypothetical protein
MHENPGAASVAFYGINQLFSPESLFSRQKKEILDVFYGETTAYAEADSVFSFRLKNILTLA